MVPQTAWVLLLSLIIVGKSFCLDLLVQILPIILFTCQRLSPSATVNGGKCIEVCVKLRLTVACAVVPVPGLYDQRVCPLERQEKRNESGEIQTK